MLIRGIRVAVGILLIPIGVAATKAFVFQLGQISGLAGLSGYFLNGVVIYIIIHLALYKPNFIYIFGHEIAHSLACLMCGGQVRSFRVSPRDGGVLITKTNFFIALFPYFFPTYTIFFWLVYFLLSVFVNVSAFTPHFLFLIGFTLTMHLVMTIDAIRVKQSDIFRTGYIFSVSLIYLLNVLLVSFILSLVFKGFIFSQFFRSVLNQSALIYSAAYKQLFL